MADFTPLAPAGFKTELETAFDAKVALTGDQTVGGVKTFTSSPVVPAPTTDLQAATKKYVDDNAGGGGGVTPSGDFGLDSFVTGRFYGPGRQMAATHTITVNQIRVAPFYVPTTQRIDRIACNVTTAGDAESTVEMAVYKVEGGVPTERVASGSALADSTGQKEATVDVTLAAGWYATGINSAQSGIAVRAFNNNTGLSVGSASTVVSNADGAWVQNVAGTPDPFVALSTLVSNAAYVTVRAADPA